MSRLSREMKMLAKQAGGSHKTVHDRIRIMDRFSRHLLALNIQVRDVKHLKAKHIESYITDRFHRGSRSVLFITKWRHCAPFSDSLVGIKSSYQND